MGCKVQDNYLRWWMDKEGIVRTGASWIKDKTMSTNDLDKLIECHWNEKYQIWVREE
jgi:hypothetical protein